MIMTEYGASSGARAGVGGECEVRRLEGKGRGSRTPAKSEIKTSPSILQYRTENLVMVDGLITQTLTSRAKKFKGIDNQVHMSHVT